MYEYSFGRSIFCWIGLEKLTENRSDCMVMTLQNITSHSGTRWPSSRPLSKIVAVLKTGWSWKIYGQDSGRGFEQLWRSRRFNCGFKEKFGGRGFWFFVRSGSESYTGSSNTAPYPYRPQPEPAQPLHSQLRNEREWSQNIVLLP